MGDVYWSVHAPLAALCARSGIDTAIETGTFFGVGTLQLAALFKSVWSIEKNEKLSSSVRSLYSACENVRFLNSPAPDGLRRVLNESEGPYFFFLDAHWFPAASLKLDRDGKKHCEVVDEIAAIAEYCSASDGSIILIDDADMFLRSLPPVFDDSFPTIFEIYDALRKQFSADFVDVIDDVIFASSIKNREIFETYLRFKKTSGAPSYKSVSI